MQEDIRIDDPQAAVADANLLRAAAQDMRDDWILKKGEALTHLENVHGDAKVALHRNIEEYGAAFERLAAIYDDLGRRVVAVINHTIETDLALQSLWNRNGSPDMGRVSSGTRAFT